ncbi:carboxylesterase family domain-containing protein [Ditylenchus destructor]|nr:carboxylesterase family domain-containing protein [Ditylenchus destructor]
MGSQVSHHSSKFSQLVWGQSYSPSQIVELKCGSKVRGKSFSFPELAGGHRHAVVIEAFLNIPFGKPPVGPLRFRKPEPADPWPGIVLDCTRFGPRCPHEDMSIERLNVFFYPKESKVQVFVHGGGFAVHSAAHYGDYGICRNLCTKDVVVVTIQYRLGFFGFLSTADENAPGNWGLWDQTLALQWVQDNISAFGGDPRNVTLFGQSAGGASVDLLSVSPHSRHLFHKMIPMSGTGYCTFATNSAEHVRHKCLAFAQQLGFKLDASASLNDQNRALVEFFRSQPTQALELSLIGKRGFKGVNQNGQIDLTPVIDGHFFPKPIDELRKEAPPKAVMTGVTEFESLLFAAIKPPRGSLKEEVYRVVEREFVRRKIPNPEKHVPIITEMYFPKAEKSDLANTSVADIYKPPPEAPNGKSHMWASIASHEHREKERKRRRRLAEDCIQLASDVLINNGVWHLADRCTELGHTVYLYSFDYCNPHGFGIAGLLFPFKGATHCSELPYLFNRGIIANFYPSAEDLEMIERFASYFVNFARYGNPNGPPEGSTSKERRISSTDCQKDDEYWHPLKADNTCKYFSIRLRGSEMRDNFCGGRPVEWRKMLENRR